MSRKRLEHEYVPLGELLLNARLERRLSRADVGKMAGISENSLARYERAGIEKDGQYPPSPKLAALCFALQIPPIRALLGCLPEEEYFGQKGTFYDDLNDHPDFEYLNQQHFALIQENRVLGELLKIIILPDERDKYSEEAIENLQSKVIRIFEAQKQFGNFMEQMTGLLFSSFEPGMMSVPGDPGPGGERDTSKWDYRTYPRDEADGDNKKGSGHKDPSPSESSTNNQGAVGAAPTDRTKKGSDR